MRAAPSTLETKIRRVAEVEEETIDRLAVEEPLEIRLSFTENGRRETRAISITMRTPGSDHDLAAGFLFTEGIVRSRDQITQIRHCGVPADKRGIQNTVVVELADDVDVDIERLKRNFYTTSSCGVCGKSSIEALHTGATRIESDLAVISERINELPDRLRAHQSVFDSTGGLHASALFDIDG